LETFPFTVARCVFCARAQRLVDELKEAVIVQKDCLNSYLEESFACRDDKVYSAGTKGLALLVPSSSARLKSDEGQEGRT